MSDISHVMEQKAPQDSRNRNRTTRQIVIMALFVALSVILSFLEFSIFPAASFLKYDASGAVAMLAGFAFGPISGIVVGVLSAAIHGLFAGDPWGTLMTSIIVICWVLPASLIYRLHPTRAMCIVGLLVGSIVSIAGAIGGNLLITPIYTGVPVEVVMTMILPILLPFNILKVVINDVIAFILNEPLSKLVER